jgi:hypothetical protein
MTPDDELPWNAPWTVRREPQDEAAFVADVSAALHVPHAAPEIRMIAEVMAVLDIPSQPDRGRTVAQLLEEERAVRESDNVIRLRGRRLFGSRIAAAGAAAAIAVGLMTASAYAGVLPDSIQKIAHSVINAPSPQQHDETPDGPRSPGNDDRTSAPASGSSVARTTPSGPQPSSTPAVVPGGPSSGSKSGSAHSSGQPSDSTSSHGHGKDHRSGQPTVTGSASHAAGLRVSAPVEPTDR